jgi:hypothetical protein
LAHLPRLGAPFAVSVFENQTLHNYRRDDFFRARSAAHGLEVLFAHTYLILFGKLSAGGLLALAVPPFFEVERGFYKSTAAVYVAMGYLMAGGEAYLLARYGQSRVVTPASVAAWTLFVGLFSAYVVTLFFERPRLRARVFPAAVAAGFFALAVTTWTYAPDNAGFFAGLPYAATAIAGAAAAGAGVTGMLLGHWYLIETGLDLLPLRRMLAFCRATVAIELIVIPLAALTLWMWAGSPLHEGFAAAFGERFYLLIVGRVCAWLLALVLLALIGRTLAIPQTMAATGLFYIQALTVTVGQIFGHWLLFRTGLPL